MGVLLKIPRGGGLPGEGDGGGEGVYGEFGRGGGGGAEAPFTVKMSSLFGENALFSGAFQYLLVFYRIWGRASGRNFSFFFRRVSGLRVLNLCDWSGRFSRGISKMKSPQPEMGA